MPSGPRWSGAPTPESWSSAGELIAPAQRIYLAPGPHLAAFPTLAVDHPHRTPALEDEFFRMGAEHDTQIGPAPHRQEERMAGVHPPPAVDEEILPADAFLHRAVEVVVARQAERLAGRWRKTS